MSTFFFHKFCLYFATGFSAHLSQRHKHQPELQESGVVCANQVQMSGQVVCFSVVALTSQLFDIFCGFTSFQLNIYIFRNNFNVIYLTPFIIHNSCVSKNNSTVIKERMFKYVIFKTKLFTLWYICS